MKVELISSFLIPAVSKHIQEKYGDKYYASGDKIWRTFPTYPYPKVVGYWFLREDDLFMVMYDE